jgi:FAD/FMN-containing dehydrogenase
LKSKVSYPASAGYARSLATYFSDQEAELTPDCIVLPTRPEDVATAVKILSAANLVNGNSCPFAVKSGGHTPFAGSANIDSGITIDLAGLNEITVSADKTITTLGAGQRWGAVYEQLAPRGLMVVGGKSAPVGIGGITTGGMS